VIRGLKERVKTIMLTTHNMEEAEQLCDRVAIMDHGRIIELDHPARLINKYFKETAIDFVALGTVPREQLKALPGVEHTLHENGRVTLYSSDVPHTMSGLLEMAEGDTLTFKDMTVRQATLEDVFLKLTGRRIRG
jgi:ABC-2 type transport system ATP-binding protein